MKRVRKSTLAGKRVPRARQEAAARLLLYSLPGDFGLSAQRASRVGVFQFILL
jgi:hypothetical protein